jgi:hypothetical protein
VSTGQRPKDLVCSVDGCEKPARGRGLCRRHYSRWRRHGDPLVVTNPHGTARERFWPKVNKNGPIPEHRPELGPCWIWTAFISPKGYGQFMGDDRQLHAHRWAYEDAHGPIPPGHDPDHLCRNRACVKAIADEHGPAHLEAVTHRENTLRGESPCARHARKTHCKHGHPFDEANTFFTSKGYRVCRTCKRAKDAAFYWRQKGRA